MSRSTNFSARRATRWWSAPLRFTTETIASLRASAPPRERLQGRWLTQTPVGIRTPLDAQP